MYHIDSAHSFHEQVKRMYLVTATRSHAELAAFLGIRQSVVLDAKRRKKIPASWLITLFLCREVSPEWVLTGRGSRYLKHSATTYETAQETQEKVEHLEKVRSISSKLLAEEMLRRSCIAEAKRFLK